MKSLYFRYLSATALMVMMSFLMVGVAFVFLGRDFIISSHRESMEDSAEVVSLMVLTKFDAGVYTAESVNGVLSSPEVRVLLNGASLLSGNDIIVTNADGLVLSCCDEPGACPHIRRSVGESTIMQLASAGTLSVTGTLDGLYDTMRYIVGEKIDPGGGQGPVGYVFMSTDSSRIIGAWQTFIWVFFMVSLAVLSLALIMSLVTSKRLAKPLDEMAAAARKFAHGDFSVRVTQEEGADELASLTAAFNNMADSLQRSEQMRNEFIANVSHELKTPMTTIAGFADGILDGTIPKEQEEKYLTTIADETRRLSRLVRQMLDLSRMQTKGADLTRRRDFDVNELIISTLLNFETRAEEKGLDVDLQLPEVHMMVTADPDAITQVPYNLLENTVKFADRGSTLTLSLWKENSKAYISVKDCGATIPPDDLPLIFDRFHKSDRSRSLDRDGVGLGLYLVKNILDAHNEDIAVTSRDGVTEFVFTLRLAARQKPEKPKAEKQKAEKPKAEKPQEPERRKKVRK